MKLVDVAVKQPITVAVGVILTVMVGLMALNYVPVQMSPNVDSVVISVSTYWENASPVEVESDIIDEQEQRLGNVANLISMTSTSESGVGNLRLEFQTGTDINKAMAEVTQRLNEVPSYPTGVSEPEIEPVDPDSVDYIAWVGLASTDAQFDPTTLYDFMNRRLLPRFERISGVSQVGVVGVQEQEVQIHVDAQALAYRGITYRELLSAIELNNDNYSAGKLSDGKNDIRIRAIGRYDSIEQLGDLLIRRDASGSTYLKDVADIRESYKERTNWVRARGLLMPFFNFQLEHGANLLQTMTLIKTEIDTLNAENGLLAQEAKRLGLQGTLELVQTYDSSTYVDQAIDLVQSNILIGGLLATLTLLLFLRSLKSIGIIAIAIPISVLASMVVMVLLGRSINIISLAGMAFAVGMVVDNAIVVIENIYRHLEMGKTPRQAAIEGGSEVAGAVLAATVTTIVVFLPILFIDDSAGQLFRDIALAIMSAVGLSLIVSLTVIPSCCGRWLKSRVADTSSTASKTASDIPSDVSSNVSSNTALKTASKKTLENNQVAHDAQSLSDHSDNRSATTLIEKPQSKGLFQRKIGQTVSFILQRPIVKYVSMAVFIVVTFMGTWLLMPPIDYLPKGNRNVAFSLLFTPPGYNLGQLSEIGHRLEDQVRPAWEKTDQKFVAEQISQAHTPLPEIPLGFGQEGSVLAPEIKHYFLVGFGSQMFQIAITEDPKKVVDAIPFLNHTLRGTAAPDVVGFSFQFPLFRTGGTTGSAISIDISGSDLDAVIQSSSSLLIALVGEFGPYSTTPDPSNFLLPTPELRIIPNDERLRELGMTRNDFGLAVQANGDGLILLREFVMGGELRDIKIVAPTAFEENAIEALLNVSIATPSGAMVDLRSVATVDYVRVQDEIRHVDRQRAVSLQLTPPKGIPLQAAIDSVNEKIQTLRASGGIDNQVEIQLAGSAGKLNDIKNALLGDGTFWGTLTSSMFLALLMVYLMMVILFQSWRYPFVIMVSVPLATFGGFVGLALMHEWSVIDRYMPVQNLDVLTLIGFVILAGVVVNNAILIVHQTLNFMKQNAQLQPYQAIVLSVESRVRPILMSTLTSVGGMLPLVFLPGAGSELYRGLGAVVVGGLLLSTLFTLFLVPMVLSLVLKPQEDREERAMATGYREEYSES